MLIPLALYAVAVAVRLLLVAGFADPAYPDSSYYVDVARSLAAGQGFTVDFVWIFPEVGGGIPADPTLPIPSNAHWMPLASIVQVPFIWVLGETAVASALPFILLGALAAPLTWAIARDAGTTRFVAFGAGLLVAIPAASTVFMPQPDNFSLYQPLVAGALWMGARGLRGDRRSFVLAGLLAGLATFSRNDGVLVVIALAVVFGWDRWMAWRSHGGRLPALSWTAAIVSLGLFVAVMAPWWARQLAVFGSISPTTATGKVFFLRDIAEWNSITTPATLGWLLEQGVGPLLDSRVGGLVAAVTIFSVLVGALVLVPLLLVGAWHRRRSPDFRPFFVFALGLFAFSALLSAIHVPGGTFIHSAVALVPHSYILAFEGLAIAVSWVAARRPSWNAEQATRVFGTALIVFAWVVALGSAVLVHATWDAERRQRIEVAGQLDVAGAAMDDRLMSIDAAGYRYWTGRGGVVTPNDPIETIEEVARAYEVRWLVVERAQGVDALAPVIDGTSTPGWLGPPVYAADADGVPLVGPDGLPATGPDAAIALFPVCTTAADTRCTDAGTASRVPGLVAYP